MAGDPGVPALSPATAERLSNVIEATTWGIAAGLLARAMFGEDKPGWSMTLLAGFSGSLLGYLVAHELLGLHEMHLFAPEGLLPSCLVAAALLLVANRLRRGHRRTTIFG